MKKNHIIFIAVIMMMVSGCDFFRKVAGRPTSDDIRRKKEAIAKAEMETGVYDAAEAQEDSVMTSVADIAVDVPVEKESVEDSLNARAVLKQYKCVMYNLKSLKGLSSGELSHKYYIIVGSFKDSANADKFFARVAEDPVLEPVKMHFRTGMEAVGVCPRDRLSEIAEMLEYVKEQPFCPKDAWVLVNQE